MSDASHINFQIVLESPAAFSAVYEGRPTEVGTALLGLIRHSFRINTIEGDEDEIFGTPGVQGKIVVKELRFQGVSQSTFRVSIDSHTNAATSDSLIEEVVVPSGAMIVGTVAVRGRLEEHQLTLLKSAILGIESIGLGRRRHSGFGQCRIELIDLKEVGRVFISYTREDAAHMEWVLHLADRLSSESIFVVLDQYDLQIGDNVHVFMEQAINRANKILLVLTPTYSAKASSRTGGAGFEFSLITSALFNNIADNKKFLPIIRRGNFETSVPASIKPFLCCDMSDDRQFESRFSEIYSSIVGIPPKRRPYRQL